MKGPLLAMFSEVLHWKNTSELSLLHVTSLTWFPGCVYQICIHQWVNPFLLIIARTIHNYYENTCLLKSLIFSDMCTLGLIIFFRLPVRSGVAEFTQWYMSRNRVGYLQANCFEKWTHRLEAEGHKMVRQYAGPRCLGFPRSLSGAGPLMELTYLPTVQVSKTQIFLHMN